MNILIAIGSCQEWEDTGCNQAVRDTWVKDIPSCVVDGYSVRTMDYRFFHGQNAEPKADVVILDVPDERIGIIQKTQGNHRWAYEHGYDFVFQCWSDTYVNVFALLASGFENHDYFGLIHSAPGAPKAQWGFLSGGEGWWASRRACKALMDAEPSKSLKYNNGMADDLWVGDVMGAAGCRMAENKEYGRTITRHGSALIQPYTAQWMRDTHAARR